MKLYESIRNYFSGLKQKRAIERAYTAQWEERARREFFKECNMKSEDVVVHSVSIVKDNSGFAEVAKRDEA